MVEGTGGGTCQVASTLHAIAFFGGLDIVQRLPHSRPSGYIPAGLDATVVYPVVDLKLRNPFTFPVVVHATVSANSPQDGAARRGQAGRRDVRQERPVDDAVRAQGRGGSGGLEAQAQAEGHRRHGAVPLAGAGVPGRARARSRTRATCTRPRARCGWCRRGSTRAPCRRSARTCRRRTTASHRRRRKVAAPRVELATAHVREFDHMPASHASVRAMSPVRRAASRCAVMLACSSARSRASGRSRRAKPHALGKHDGRAHSRRHRRLVAAIAGGPTSTRPPPASRAPELRALREAELQLFPPAAPARETPGLPTCRS